MVVSCSHRSSSDLVPTCRPSRTGWRAPLIGLALLSGCVGALDENGSWSEDGYEDAEGPVLTEAGAPSDAAPSDRDSSALDAGGSSPADGGGATEPGPALDAGALDGALPQEPRDASADARTSSPPDASSAPDAAVNVDAAAPSSNDVPAGAHCDPVRDWNPAWAQFELDVLRLTNEARAVGHNCDTGGNFGPAPALTMDSRLRCSARLHSRYMATTGEFAHDEAQTQLDPFERMTAAGYRWSAASENIAAGQRTPADVVKGWLDSDGHCANIMSKSVVHIGIGYMVPAAGSPAKYGNYWTQNFASPR